jgi:hypothetical protein
MKELRWSWSGRGARGQGFSRSRLRSAAHQDRLQTWRKLADVGFSAGVSGLLAGRDDSGAAGSVCPRQGNLRPLDLQRLAARPPEVSCAGQTMVAGSSSVWLVGLITPVDSNEQPQGRIGAEQISGIRAGGRPW